MTTHHVEPAKKARSEDTPITSYLTPAEMAVLVDLGRLRFGCYVGTAGELYSHLTGRKHPKMRGEAPWRGGRA